jgi:hypothetical protein
MDHLLSLVVFGGAAAEFLLWPKFGSSTYALLSLLALADFLSGVALRTRRGAVRTAAPAQPAERRSEPARSEPKLQAPPAAAPVAESVLMDRPDPKPGQPAASEPTIVSPGLQPAGGSSASPQAPQT